MIPITAVPVAAAVSDAPTGFGDWLAHAAPGARCVYHRGHLTEDRHPITTRLGKAARRQLDRTTDLALAMAATGQVLLVQRRLDDGDYSYLAIKTARKPLPVDVTARRVRR